MVPTATRGSLADALERHERLLSTAAAAADVAVVTDVALSYGIGVPDDASYLVRARTNAVPTLRRTSGGAGLLHLEGDLVWALVLPLEDRRVGRDHTRAFGRLGAPVVEGLRASGIDAGWATAPGFSEEYCPLSSRGEVLQANGKIVGGAAQHRTSHALLHHGTVSWRVDRSLVVRLFALEPRDAAERLDGVAGVTTASGPEELAERLGRTLAAAVT